MKALAFLGGVVGLIVLMAFSAVFSGYALSVLWGWFIVPIFHLPQLSITAAIGISLVIGYLTHQIINDPKDSDRSFAEKIGVATAYSILKPGSALLIGWVVHLFM